MHDSLPQSVESQLRTIRAFVTLAGLSDTMGFVVDARLVTR